MWKFFRARSKLRDKEADSERFARVSAVIMEVMNEVEQEKHGLHKRYLDDRERASALLFALEAETARPQVSTILDRIETAMNYYEQRADELDALSVLLRELKRDFTVRETRFRGGGFPARAIELKPTAQAELPEML